MMIPYSTVGSVAICSFGDMSHAHQPGAIRLSA
jgi:hypothetical protein